MGFRPPNVLLICVHDLGTRLGCYGHESVHSPNLDRLAGEGVRFTRNFCTAPYCSPSRGSIITGKYPHVNGLMGLVNLGWNWDGGNLTLAKALGAVGYETFLFGFQHEAREDEVSKLGFGWVRDQSLSIKCKDVTPDVEAFLAGRARANDRPFYARIGFFEVHRPFHSTEGPNPSQVKLPAWVDETPGAREDFAQYDGDIRHMDRHVGRILKALEGAGLTENTLVIFTTDHGSPFPRAKATLYDAGINTALVMRWPRGIKGGRVLSEMIGSVDLFPTLLEMAGADVPDDIQGRSFLPLLQGGESPPRDFVFAEKNSSASDPKRCVRTTRFKYIRNLGPGPELLLGTSQETSLTRRDMGNDHLRPRPEVELYDLENDPVERRNLAGTSEFAEVERELAELLNRVMVKTGDPILRGPIPRPEAEEELLRGAFERTLARCTYPREGLVCGYEMVRREAERASP